MRESLWNIFWDLVYEQELIFFGFSPRNQKQEKPCFIGELKISFSLEKIESLPPNRFTMMTNLMIFYLVYYKHFAGCLEQLHYLISKETEICVHVYISERRHKQGRIQHRGAGARGPTTAAGNIKPLLSLCYKSIAIEAR